MQIMDHYRGKVRLVIKNYPYKYRDFSHLAAEAALAAGEQGKYWQMHELLLEKSPRLDRESLLAYAAQVGLDVEQFARSIDGRLHSEDIEEDVQLARAMDLYNTPTFFINGRKVIGNRSFEYLKKIIDEELEHEAE